MGTDATEVIVSIPADNREQYNLTKVKPRDRAAIKTLDIGRKRLSNNFHLTNLHIFRISVTKKGCMN